MVDKVDNAADLLVPVDAPQAPPLLRSELVPIALATLKELMLNAKSEKVRLDAAATVAELEGLKGRPSTTLGLTFNVPPEYLGKAFKSLGKLKVGLQDSPDDLETSS